MSKTMFRDDYDTIREVIVERGEEIEFMSPYLSNSEIKALTLSFLTFTTIEI
ncbi:TPA: hypothetical protein NKT82_001619 [Vibrio parahaemolyticus]|nr:hypothetical protein [Vibrio parahaemolyticus]HCM1535916.1 hypothetical protein [Vibrio parahaemolyticus]